MSNPIQRVRVISQWTQPPRLYCSSYAQTHSRTTKKSPVRFPGNRFSDSIIYIYTRLCVCLLYTRNACGRGFSGAESCTAAECVLSERTNRVFPGDPLIQLAAARVVSLYTHSFRASPHEALSIYGVHNNIKNRMWADRLLLYLFLCLCLSLTHTHAIYI